MIAGVLLALASGSNSPLPLSMEQIDLKAAYCSGRLSLVEPFATPTEPGLADMIEKSNRELANAKAHLKAYLVPRVNVVANPDALLAAARAGEEDQRSYDDMVGQCALKGRGVMSCASGVLADKLIECRSLGFLPF